MTKSSIILYAKNKIRTHAPWVLVKSSRFYARNIGYKKERAYLNGERSSSYDNQSILFFTTIRCASQYINSLISKIYEDAGGVSINLPRYLFHARPTNIKQNKASELTCENLDHKGYHYGALRPLKPAISTDYYNVIVVVRDPRDIMVSFYYSLAYAHTPSDTKFAADAKTTRERGIEWFIRQPERLEMVKSHLDNYIDNYWRKKGVSCFKYEEIMNDFPNFIKSLAEAIKPGPINQKLCDELSSAHALSRVPKEENKLSHMRSGKSGQFRDKLSKDSVEYLNDYFKENLYQLGYEI